MSERSIKQLKNKFIVTAMVSFFLAMTFIAVFIFVLNTTMTGHQIEETLEFLAENDGVLPESYESYISDKKKQPSETAKNKNEVLEQLKKLFGIESEYTSAEFYHATRYFAVLYNDDMETEDVILSHMVSVNEDRAKRYAQRALDKWFDFGRINNFYYIVQDRESAGKIVVMVDCGTQVSINRRLMTLACILIIFGMLISFFVIRTWSERIIKPEIRNSEMQKAFITNASHELKTPLAVIRANTEMIEMTEGESELTHSILNQVDRLTGLVQNLVLVTRASEADSKADRKLIDFSKIVKETVKTYETVAVQEGKAIEGNVAEDIFISAHESDIRQIVTLLVDNAIKYCDDNGEITVNLEKEKRGKHMALAVSNTYINGSEGECTRYFERFYRGDSSHNIDKEGYGIGLSIAKSLTDRYHGNINAIWKDGIITFTCGFPC